MTERLTLDEIIASAAAHIDRLRAERDRLTAVVEGLEGVVASAADRIDRLQAECDAMRPVVEAAEAWVDADVAQPVDPYEMPLFLAVDTYREGANK